MDSLTLIHINTIALLITGAVTIFSLYGIRRETRRTSEILREVHLGTQAILATQERLFARREGKE